MEIKTEEITTPSEQQVDRIIKWIDEKTSKSCYRLSININRNPGLSDTKFGGVPYWTADKEYPTAPGGTPLILLAQLNMKDFSGNPLLPSEGILQFFIGCDDLYGMDFDEPDIQSSFRIVYHPHVDETVTAEKNINSDFITSLNTNDKNDYFPLDGEYAVDVEETSISIGTLDYRYEDYMQQASEALEIKLPESAGIYDILSEDQYSDEAEKAAGHQVLGYPYFTQNDPRECQENLQYYDTLLFQMDSDFGRDNGYEIIWGDSGVANFFINHEDLKNLDFSKVLYNWDCC